MKILKDCHLFTPEEKHADSGSIFETKPGRYSVRRYVVPRSSGSMIYSMQIFQSQISYPHSYRRWGDGFFSLEIILDGELYVRNNDRFYIAEAGDIFLMHPGDFAEFLLPPGGICKKISISFQGALIPVFLQHSGLDHVDIQQNCPIDEISAEINHMTELAGSNDPDAAFQNEIESFRILQLLQKKKKITVPEKYAAVHKKMLMHPETTYSVTEMAKTCGCSTAFFLRKFNQYYGQTPHQFLIETRMRRAVFLLLGSRLSVKEIAGMCGFSDQLKFSAAFSKKYGLSPRKFRKKELLLA